MSQPVIPNVYSSYAEKLARPTPLTGPLATRAEARLAYGSIIAKMHACGTLRELQTYLAAEQPVLRQFEKELPFFWQGDGEDFLGLSDEMLMALDKFKNS